MSVRMGSRMHPDGLTSEQVALLQASVLGTNNLISKAFPAPVPRYRFLALAMSLRDRGLITVESIGNGSYAAFITDFGRQALEVR